MDTAAAKPKRKRRWYQFSLRTLMIVVTLVAAQCAFVAWVIRDRDRLIQEREFLTERLLQRQALQQMPVMPGVSVTTAGDSVFISIPAGTSAADISEVRRLFPKAKIRVSGNTAALGRSLSRTALP